MHVTFFSNYLNHHQLPFCMAMERLTGGQFTFVATTPVPRARMKLGYHDMNKQYSFVLTTYDSRENQLLAEKLAVQSDVVIHGSAPEKYVAMRLRQNKLTFRYSERWYKKGLPIKRVPRALVGSWLHHGRWMHKPLYMLCASAYTAADCARFGNYLGRTYKWGYFPEVKVQDVDELIAHKRENKRIFILWVGRLIEWKHPEAALLLAEKLRERGVDFDLKIIGNGAMEQSLKLMVQEKRLDEYVHMLGAMPPEQVRRHMEAADIFLFTSDFNEGWGAVLNESMNSGCAVVASHAIGSVPFMIQDGKTGLIYRNGDMNGLYDCVVKLISEPSLREELGRRAYQTIAEQWNAEAAAERFLQLADALLSGKPTDLFIDGPCSKAKFISNGWYKNGKNS